MGAVAERGRELGLKQAPARDAHVEQLRVAVVVEDLGIVRDDQVNPRAHLEDACAEEVVGRSLALWIGPGPVDHAAALFSPDRAAELVRAVPEPVVVDVVLEAARLFADRRADEFGCRATRPIEQLPHGREI